MIELRTLGCLDLQNADGQRLHGILVQPKRLALLAYLALARPRGFQRRDVLVGVFWPEMDHEHARSALRTAVHVIGQQLGPGVLIRRGDEELGLVDGAVWCDVVALEQALAEHRLDEALSLYRGDLLSGFFVSGAPEFERWVETERAHLREQAAAGAWALAERAAGEMNNSLAVRWGRRALSYTPGDESAVQRLIVFFYKIGDRAAALQAYSELESRLAKEYGARPSAETRLLVGRVKASGETYARVRQKEI